MQHISLLPSSFDAAEVLPRRLARYRDDANYFVNAIVRKNVRNRCDKRGRAGLRAEYLRKIMSFRHYHDVIESLLEAGVIHRAPYWVGKYPFRYWLDYRFRGDKHVRVPVENKRLQRKIGDAIARTKARTEKRLLPIHRKLKRIQRRLSIDPDQAQCVLQDLPEDSNPFDAQGIQVADIQEQRFRLTVGNCGRVFNNITSLKRDLRRTLRCDGNPLVGLDISCCQPSLLALLMLRFTPPGKGKNVTSYKASLCLPPLPLLSSVSGRLSDCCSFPSVERFADLCLSGSLYQFLSKALAENGHPATLSQVKQRFLCDVLAKRKANRLGAEYPSEIEQIFKGEFPSVWQFIRIVNGQGWQHWELIRILQQVESWLVIQNVCQRFVDKHPEEFLITLHDAIYVRPDAVELARTAFEDVFADLDFPMTLKVGSG
ncbi:MAG: hypothetical protein MPJ50_19470 [Pirellulales bacterium]|nr:hypothetical protein [Pirellulales bacterium]